MPETIVTKQCTACKQIKETSEFYKDRSRRDGLYPQCKLCKRAYQKRYEQTLERKVCHKRYRQSPKGKARKRAYEQSEKGTVVRNAVRKRYHEKYPEKRKAHHAISTAIRAGKLPRPDTLKCSCGKQALEYHHPDYSKPLEVVALCVDCHKKIP